MKRVLIMSTHVAQNVAQRTHFYAPEQLNRLESRIAVLESLNIRDEVTGLLNRIGMRDALRREIARTDRLQNASHLYVAVQIDNLDGIEGAHGILAAQMAAKILSRTLSGQAREYDLLARIERDEFALLLIHADVDAAIARIQTLNMGLNRLSFPWNDAQIDLHVSLSVKNCNSAQSLKDLDI